MLGNPKGDVTLVEFFDYNCGYCKRALTDMIDLMKNDPKLKVVLKEFPVLGQGSVEAAKVAVAVRMQDKTGKKYLDFHQKLLGGRGQADKARALAVAKEVGIDMARLEKDMASDEVKRLARGEPQARRDARPQRHAELRGRRRGRGRRGRPRRAAQQDRHRPLRQGNLLISADLPAPGHSPALDCAAWNARPDDAAGTRARRSGRDGGNGLRPQRAEPESARHARAGELRPLDARRRRDAVPRRGRRARLGGRVPPVQPRGRDGRLDPGGGAKRGAVGIVLNAGRLHPHLGRDPRRDPRGRSCRPSRCTSPTSMPASRSATIPIVSMAAKAVICGFGIAGYALAIDGLAALARATERSCSGDAATPTTKPRRRRRGDGALARAPARRDRLTEIEIERAACACASPARPRRPRRSRSRPPRASGRSPPSSTRMPLPPIPPSIPAS